MSETDSKCYIASELLRGYQTPEQLHVIDLIINKNLSPDALAVMTAVVKGAEIGDGRNYSQPWEGGHRYRLWTVKKCVESCPTCPTKPDPCPTCGELAEAVNKDRSGHRNPTGCIYYKRTGCQVGNEYWPNCARCPDYD